MEDSTITYSCTQPPLLFNHNFWNLPNKVNVKPHKLIQKKYILTKCHPSLPPQSNGSSNLQYSSFFSEVLGTVPLKPEGVISFTSSSRLGPRPILGHGREVPQWWPPVLRFSIWMDPYFMPHYDQIVFLFLQTKIRLSLNTFSSRDTWT